MARYSFVAQASNNSLTVHAQASNTVSSYMHRQATQSHRTCTGKQHSLTVHAQASNTVSLYMHRQATQSHRTCTGKQHSLTVHAQASNTVSPYMHRQATQSHCTCTSKQHLSHCTCTGKQHSLLVHAQASNTVAPYMHRQATLSHRKSFAGIFWLQKIATSLVYGDFTEFTAIALSAQPPNPIFALGAICHLETFCYKCMSMDTTDFLPSSCSMPMVDTCYKEYKHSDHPEGGRDSNVSRPPPFPWTYCPLLHIADQVVEGVLQTLQE